MTALGLVFGAFVAGWAGRLGWRFADISWAAVAEVLYRRRMNRQRPDVR